MGDAQGFDAGGLVECASGGGGGELVEEIESLTDGRKVLLPQLGEYCVDLVRGGFLRCQLRLVLPAEDFGDLLSEGEGVEGLEENAGEAESGEAALVDPLDLGSQQKDGNVRDGGVLLHGAEGSRAIDSGITRP